ncbi:MAG: transporter substrate-binding domain-containing protein, partial [Pseudomonadota bacterium]
MQGLCFSRTAQVLTGALVLFGLALTGADPAQAQAPQTPQAPAEITVPNYWDPNRRAPKPDLTGLRTIRFLTEIEAPPFSYRAADGELTGFNVEIARGICRALEVACTIQALRWDLLLSGIEDGRGDAIIAAVPMTGDSRRSFQFSNRFLAFPGRFVARRDNAGGDVAPSALSGARVAVVGGTAHEAFLQAFYSESDIVPYETLPEAR